VSIEGAARIVTNDGKDADFGLWRPNDGFSRQPAIVAAFHQAVATTGLTLVNDPEDPSVAQDSPTVILEAGTHRRIPHFVDVDTGAIDLTRRAVILHPRIQLEAKTRYIVALRRLVDGTGAPVLPPLGFDRLLRGDAGGDPSLGPMADHFDRDVIPELRAAAISTSDLQLAWDFTTTDDQLATRDMRRVRDLTLAWLTSHTPTTRIVSVQTSTTYPGWQHVEGFVTGARFMDGDGPGHLLFRGEDGQVAQNGTGEFAFTANIPARVLAASSPVRVLEYGHGFFGFRTELTDGAGAHAILDKLGAVGFAIDWVGMAREDAVGVAGMLLSDPAHGLEFTDRVHQAMANWIILTAAIRGPLSSDPAFQRPGSGAPLYDASSVNFIGISMGHLLGGVLAAVHPDLHRIALNVGGAGLSHMMFRASPFRPFVSILSFVLADRLEEIKLMASMQNPLDRIDGLTYAGFVSDQPWPSSDPNKRVLMQIGLGDQEVPNDSAFIHARALGLKLLTPTPATPGGLPEIAAPYDGSALALYDFGVNLHEVYDEIFTAVPNYHVHDEVRLLPAVLSALDRFFVPDGKAQN
jgi:hypothetical protein